MRKPATPPDYWAIIDRLMKERARVPPEVPAEFQKEYVHWDRLRFLKAPPGTNIEDVWAGLKFKRAGGEVRTPFKSTDGKHFVWVRTDFADRTFHKLDQFAGGRLSLDAPILNEQGRNTYLVRSLIEESFSSSYLEGAVTTRSAAKEMIRHNRAPKDISERMVYNNYMAMSRIREILDVQLTEELVFEIHRIVTHGTMDRPDRIGCYRTDEDRVMVYDDSTGETLHIPPPAGELSGRMQILCNFVNGDSERFVHPILKAIIVHFMIGYDHPFYDGNGRTARALFYWCMLKNGYWLTEYISISSEITKAPKKYYRSFLETETDNNDITYFAIYNLRILDKAFNTLQEYIKTKSEEVRNVKVLLKRLTGKDYNQRQLALIEHACTHPGTLYEIESHQRSHNVHYLTARQDLEELATHNILTKVKKGRKNYYIAGNEIREMLELKLKYEDLPMSSNQLQLFLDESEGGNEL